jgi:hypothetical protein
MSKRRHRSLAGAATGLGLAALLAWVAVRPPPGWAAPARPKVKVWQEPIPPPAADPYAPDRAEAGSAEAIAALTGSLRFLPPAVAYLPESAGVPSPAAVLGHLAGAAEVGRTADVHRYFRRLAAASDRVRVQAIGSSEEGREILLAVVSASHNLAELAYFREAAARLADPRRTGPQEAERLAGSGKLVYYLAGGLEPGEVASPEMLAELAYRLAVSERPEAQAVREQAVVLITPVAEPDAYDRAVEWHRRHLRQRAGLPWNELREVLAPPYASHYAGERWAAAGDDGLGLASTRAMSEAFFGFHPQLLQELGTSPPLVAVGGAAAGPRAAATPAAEPGAAGPRGQAPPEDTGVPEREAAGPSATAPRGAAGAAGELAAGADPWPELAAAVTAALRGCGLPGVRESQAAALAADPPVGLAADQAAGMAPQQAVDVPRAPAAGLALAMDHNAAAGVIGVFGNGAPGDYDREMGELEAAAGENGASGQANGAGSADLGDAAGPTGGVTRLRRQGRGSATPPGAAAGARSSRPRGPERVRTMAAGWPPGGHIRWSLRDSVNYAESATLAALAWAAGHRRELLEGGWRRAARSLEGARAGPPFAWLLPARQPDPGRLAALVRRLLDQRIEVHRLSEELTLGDGRRLPAGSYLVRLDQPYREAALRFLAGRPGPGGGGRPEIPWPLLYGVEAVAIEDRAVLDAAMTAVAPAAAVPPPGGIEGGEALAPLAPWAPWAPATGGGEAPTAANGAGTPAAAAAAARRDQEVFLLRDTGQVSLLAARIALGSYQVDAAEAAFTAGGIAYPAGSWLVQAPRFRVASVADRLGLTFAAAAALPEVPRHVVHLPRLGVLHGWTDAEPSGWVRHALDREHVPYSLIGDGDVRRGGLGERFDVLVLAGADRDWRRRLRGIDAGWSPLAFTRVAEFPSHGVPDGAADITGGLGEPGLQELRRFVAGGGVLVTLGSASALVTGAGLAAGLSLGTPPGAARASGVAADDTETAASSPGPAASPGAAGAGEAPEAPSAAAESSGGSGPPGSDAEASAAAAPTGAGTAGGTGAAGEPPEVFSAAPAAGPTDTAGPAGSAGPGAAAESAGSAAAAAAAAELRARVVRRDHPVAYGYPELTQVLRRGGPLLWVTAAARGSVVLQFGAGRHAAAASGAAAPASGEPPPEEAGGAAATAAAGTSTSAAAAPGALEIEDIDPAKPATAVKPAPPGGAAAAGTPGGPGAPGGQPLPRPLGPDDGRLVLAGSLPEGEAAVQGRPAIVDLPLGKGHLLVFAFNPFDPTLGPADLRLVYNVLLNWHSLPR